MPGCSICSLENRAEVDKALIAGIRSTAVARKFGLKVKAVDTHSRNHVAHAIVRAAEKRDESLYDATQRRLEGLCRAAEGFLASAQAQGDGRLGLGAIREARDTLGGIYKIASDLTAGSQELQVEIIHVGEAPDAVATDGGRIDSGASESALTSPK